MRYELSLLALPALAAAQQQIPLMDQVKGWYAKASEAASQYIPSPPPPPSVPSFNPVDAGAAAVAGAAVKTLTVENYKDVLAAGGATSSPGVEEWMVFVTGGNKTCFGLCGHAESQWNRSVPLLEASKNAPHLGWLNCESETALCNAWAIACPSVIHMLIPQPLPDQSMPPTTVRNIGFNRTSVTTHEIAAIHTEQKYLDAPVYEGIWHPFDGTLAQTGLAIPLGQAMYYVSLVPSWAIMIGVSMVSRSIM